MRIAMFTNNYKPYIGGVPVSIEHLADGLRRRGHTVYVFAPSYANQEEEEYVIRYPSFPVTIAGAPIPNVLTRLFEQKVKELKIDIIHVHHPALVGNIALTLRRRHEIPLVFTYHTRYEAYLHYIKALQGVENCTGILEHYMTYFGNHCDLIVAPTPGIKRYLESSKIKTPLGILPTGVPEQSFRANPEKAAEIRRKHIGRADYLLCTVSRLAKEKNLDFQLEGLSLLKKRLEKEGKSFQYLMIGDGPEKEHLQKKAKALGIAENISMVGNVENKEIAAYQKASDVFLFSSKSETQGIVLLEAMAAANPVIAVKASGVEDIVLDGENGFLTKEDTNTWAERIQLYLTHEKVRMKMKENALQTAKDYAEEEIARMAENYYFNLYKDNKTAQNMLFHKRYVV